MRRRSVQRHEEQLGGEDYVAFRFRERALLCDCEDGGRPHSESLQDLTWQDSFVRRCAWGGCGLDVDSGAGGAPRVCVSEVMLREPGRRERMRRAGPIISALGEQ